MADTPVVAYAIAMAADDQYYWVTIGGSEPIPVYSVKVRTVMKEPDLLPAQPGDELSIPGVTSEYELVLRVRPEQHGQAVQVVTSPSIPASLFP